MISAIQARLARTALEFGIREAAELCDVSTQTLSRLEHGDELKESTLERIQKSYEKAGVQFIPENGGGVGVRLKRKSRAKRR